MNRAVLIFPPDPICQKIQQIRKKYDPLNLLIGPHMTLVFPFESDISTEVLNSHIQNVLKDMSPFMVVLQGITGTNDGYLFLNVKTGNDSLIQLHDQLYTGLLRPYLSRKHTYIPHLTVGKLSSEEAFERALTETESINETFEFWVEEIAVEQIDESGKSIIMSQIRI